MRGGHAPQQMLFEYFQLHRSESVRLTKDLDMPYV